MSKAYTKEEEHFIKEAWAKHPNKDTIKFIAKTLNKTIHSVIMKLTREGLYKKAKYARTTLTKDQVILELEAWTGMELPSLEKMTKTDLIKLLQFIKEF